MVRILFTVLILFVTFSSYAQQVIDNTRMRVTYELSYRNSTKHSFKNQEYMLLLIGEKTSKFISLNKHMRDSVVMHTADPSVLLGSLQSLPKSEFRYSIYKEINGEQLTFHDRVVKSNYEYTEPKKLFNWNITSEKKKVLGFECQKATTTFRGRNYEAWFTSEIPLSEGPYKFNGLPGLITEIKDEKEDYHFTLVGVEKPQETLPITKSDSYFEQVSREQYEKIETNSKASYLEQLAQSGITLKLSAEQKKEVRNKMNAKDNPIEL
jgi:GLPGLI family protein